MEEELAPLPLRLVTRLATIEDRRRMETILRSGKSKPIPSAVSGLPCTNWI